MQKTHQVAVQVTQKIEQLIEANHYSIDIVRSIGETVSAKWQQLMFHAEERMKLVMASTNWFKTAEQVSTVPVISALLALICRLVMYAANIILMLLLLLCLWQNIIPRGFKNLNRKRRTVGMVFNPCSQWPAHLEGQH